MHSDDRNMIVWWKKPKPIELSKVTLANKTHETVKKKESKDERCYIKTCRIIARVLGGMF